MPPSARRRAIAGAGGDVAPRRLGMLVAAARLACGGGSQNCSKLTVALWTPVSSRRDEVVHAKVASDGDPMAALAVALLAVSSCERED